MMTQNLTILIEAFSAPDEEFDQFDNDVLMARIDALTPQVRLFFTKWLRDGGHRRSDDTDLQSVIQ